MPCLSARTLLVLWCAAPHLVVTGFTNVYPKLRELPIGGDAGEPLFLTPLLEAGKIQEAQEAATVRHPQMAKTNSYSGYLTIDRTYNSNMFFWFFKANNDPANAPVIVWLQGGPGATSLFGLFAENGPFRFKGKHVGLRKYTWTDTHNVLYIDNPVGTGYSFTDDAGYCRNETIVGENLYKTIVQFFQLFPQLQRNEFYVTGESYAGKYVPALAYAIHKNNPSAKQKINLAGIAIGNGLSDPEHQLKYGDYLYQLGLVDTTTREQFHKYEAMALDAIHKKDFDAAFKVFDDCLNGDLNNHTSLFKNATGFQNYFNFLHPVGNEAGDVAMGAFVQRFDVRKAIHVGNKTFHVEDQAVEKRLMGDVMQSVAPWVSELLSHYRTLIYNGQLDIIVAYPLTVNYLKQLDFSAADEYKTAPRHIWYVDRDIAGYVKTAGNLTEILVRDAGHMVPADQPKWALDMINRFTTNKPFY